MTQVDFIHVQKYLSGVDYPATREQLLEHAKRQGADKQAMEALQRLPDKQYDGPNAVSKALAGS
ncbi:DUF2795 domain-containing protein [Sphaerisporangium sp. NPDC088356]|uniref:DUF2795 domain-containing protein n=1 Tax=Sphaerisporangium sp. NPDC088356 TaxID=3154871 RepID=UPI003434F372